MSGVSWVNSGASSAIRRWFRVSNSSASSLLPVPDSPVISTPMVKISMKTPCRVSRGASRREIWYSRKLTSSQSLWPEDMSGVSVSRASLTRSSATSSPLATMIAAGRSSMMRASVSQRVRESSPSSQSYSSRPITWMRVE